MFSVIFGLLFKMLFILGMGYVLRRKNVLTTEDKESMTKLLMKIVLIFMCLMASQEDFSEEIISAIIISGCVTFGSFLIAIPLAGLIAGRLGLSPEKHRIFVCSSVFGNVAFLGMPISQVLFGDTGLLCTTFSVIIFNITFFAWATGYISGTGEFGLKALKRNTVAIAGVLSLFMYLLQIRIPEPLYGTLGYISPLSFPLSMLIIGCSLAEVELGDLLKNSEFYMISFIKLIALPGIVFITLRLLGVERYIVQICTVLASISTATVVSIAATDSGCVPDYAVKAMLQTVIFMVVTLPFWSFVVSL